MKRINVRPLAVIHPLWQSGFYLIPISMLVVVSFWLLRDFQPTPAFNFDNYAQLLTNDVYQRGLIASVKLAGVASLIAVVLALPLAFAITFATSDRWRSFFIFALLWPFFSNYVTRMFSVQLLLGENGVINQLLMKTGLIATPLRLLYSELSVLAGLLSILVPISALIMCLSLAKLNRTLMAAAYNLGANKLQTFCLISFPFVLPGLLGAAMYCFIVSVGDFVCPRVLGGNQIYTLSILIEDRMKVNDWPMAATLGVTMMIVALFAMVLVLYGFSLIPTTRFAQRGLLANEK